MSEHNKAQLQRFYDEVIGGGAFDLIDELVHADHVEHEEFPGVEPGREGVREFFKMFRSAFPDVRFEAKDMISDGDKVAARIVVTGTHSGDFAGIAGTGRAISVNSIEIFRFQNGQIAEHWGVTDELGMMQQLGVIPEE